MLRLKNSVPKFGNWERNEDISYSIIFDKVRAEKEGSFKSQHEYHESALSSRSASPKSDGRTGNKTSHGLPTVSTRGKEKRFSETSEEDGTFAMSQQREDSKRITEKGRFYDKNQESTGPAFTSWQAAVLRDHQTFGSEPCLHNLHGWPQSYVAVCAHKPIASGAPSTQFEKTTEKQHPDQDNQAFQGRQHTKSLDSGRHSFREEKTNAKPRNSSIGTQRRPTVPKFGEWEKGDGYSTIFDNVRKERSSKQTSKRSLVRIGELNMEQDLYKRSERMKHQRSWLSSICCTKPYPEG